METRSGSEDSFFTPLPSPGRHLRRIITRLSVLKRELTRPARMKEHRIHRDKGRWTNVGCVMGSHIGLHSVLRSRSRLPFSALLRLLGAVPHDGTEWASIDRVPPRVHS
jgi:hypothetical protein